MSETHLAWKFSASETEIKPQKFENGNALFRNKTAFRKSKFGHKFWVVFLERMKPVKWLSERKLLTL